MAIETELQTKRQFINNCVDDNDDLKFNIDISNSIVDDNRAISKSKIEG